MVGYLAFRDSVEKANARLERITRAAPVAPVLDQQSGMLLSQPTTILVMGRDRNGLSDSLQLIRVDPGSHLVSTLAIPRDLKVDIPGVGSDKINVAYARGGAALAVETVREPDRRARSTTSCSSTSPGSAGSSTPSVGSTSTTRSACRRTSTGTRTTSSAAPCT